MIVYGWNSFVIGKYKPSDIGLEAELDKTVTFERRQKYFHLFWIPFFGIGKIWVLKKRSDENKYVVHPDVEKVLQYKFPSHKTPWYTFSLPLLAAVVGIIVYFTSMYSSYTRQKEYEAYEVKRKQELTAAVSNPEPGTYLEFNGNNGGVYLKILGTGANDVTCIVSRRASEYYGSDELLKMFIDDGSKVIDTMKISKADLLKTVDTGFELIPGEGELKLNEVTSYTKPVFASLDAAFDNGVFRARVRNIGASGKLLNVDLAGSNFKLKSRFPDEIAAGDWVLVEGIYSGTEPHAEGTLLLSSASQSEIAYRFKVIGTYLSIQE